MNKVYETFLSVVVGAIIVAGMLSFAFILIAPFLLAIVP